MGNLFNALNGLKTNIFGGGNTGQTTPILRKSATGMLDESPLSVLDHDPFAYSSIQYPRDLTTNGGIGHYMLFYVNVQDKTKYIYNSSKGTKVSDYATIANSETSEWTGNDGIMVFNNAFTTKDGTLLKCASTAANTINSLVIQGTNSLYDDGTMSAFALGTNVNTDTAFAENYFEHNPDTFEYSAGDTITVNWTISVT